MLRHLCGTCHCILCGTCNLEKVVIILMRPIWFSFANVTCRNYPIYCNARICKTSAIKMISSRVYVCFCYHSYKKMLAILAFQSGARTTEKLPCCWNPIFKPCKKILINYPDSKIHGTNMGPTWVLAAPDGPHVGPMNPAIRVPWILTSGLLSNPKPRIPTFRSLPPISCYVFSRTECWYNLSSVFL